MTKNVTDTSSHDVAVNEPPNQFQVPSVSDDTAIMGNPHNHNGAHAEPLPVTDGSGDPWVSVLFPSQRLHDNLKQTPMPENLDDLGLAHVILSIIPARDGNQLLPYYLTPLQRIDDVHFRHEVWRDLNDYDLVESLSQFAEAMHGIQLRLNWSRDTRYLEEHLSWHLDACLRYCRALRSLSEVLDNVALRSRGLSGVRTYLTNYLADDSFTAFEAQAEALRQRLDHIQYSLTIRGARVRVAAFENDDEYATEIRALFERFNRGGAVTTYRVNFHDSYGMNHVEAQVASRVAKLFPSEFADLRAFVSCYDSVISNVVERCVREFTFYVGYHHFMQQFEKMGLNFTLPCLTQPNDEIDVSEAFDVALGVKLLSSATAIVTNGFHLTPSERVIVVSGPNQGGKTTFARMFGQLHYLAALGLPVPGNHATLSIADEVFTHFSRKEDNTAQAGKLEQDLLRMKSIIERATPASVIVANEVFSSTTVSDALSLGTKALHQILKRGARAVYVTFVDELSRLDPHVVSMVSTVNPANPVERTYKVVQREADGRAYALAIATKYGLTYEQVRQRVNV